MALHASCVKVTGVLSTNADHLVVKNWIHVTCARAFGRCEVIHGENCHGEVLLNPWTLLCPEHSDVVPPPDSSTLEQLRMWAKEFPPEPEVEKPKPKPIPKSFSKLSAQERREFLAIPENEKALVDELLNRKLQGVRCEVCHTIEDEGKNLTSWQHPTLVTDMARKEVNLSDAIMTHGKGFILGMNRCELCGQKDGLKMKCSYSNCRQRGHRSKASHAHVTCARQAGFEVDTGMSGGDISFHINCYRHVKCEFAFRARLEDLIEFEKLRVGKKMDDTKSMSISHASRLLNSAIVVMNYLGWAWRWTEWWVEYGSNWEPLIEPGEDEKKMSKEQLKIVDSTPESRCADARRCRLAAFGAALRNRSYDEVESGPTVILERALRAVLNTPSLVGPLTNLEIDFFVQWLGIAYRSKSRLLGLGSEKIVVDETAPSSLHEDDKSPKFVLGDRRLPGEQVLPEGEVFETDVAEIDDFLKPERLEDGMLYSEFLKTKKC
ncbi:PHD-like zinc-binding domain containing protein [Fragilaria crotonensis]|nr:PHD-like zinc-binding domain containing protein [Fragilaria crotonensis]